MVGPCGNCHVDGGGTIAASATAGFWSYVHEDDSVNEGQIRRLAASVRAEYGILTGEDLELFLDRDSLQWGDEWKERISRALQGATFFIPVITPRYFMSAACREELLKFRSEAVRLGLEELLLPVYWVGVPLIDAGSPSDEAMALVASRQWEDLRDVRHQDENSSPYRVAVSRLATRLVEIAEKITQAPPASRVAGVSVAEQATADADDAPGLVDMFAEGEQAMEAIVDIVEAMTPIISQFGELAEEATHRMHAADSRGAGFAGRLREAERFASKLAEPATEIERLGQAYAAELVKIDPAVLTLIETAAEAQDDERAEAKRFFESIQGLTASAGESIDSLSELASSMDEAAGLSRGLRKPLRQIKSGLRGVIDGRALMDEWDRRIAEVESNPVSDEIDAADETPDDDKRGGTK